MGWVGTVFTVGDRVLLRTKLLLDATNIGNLLQCWDGPFTVIACPNPNTYTLALPRWIRCNQTVNVDHLKPCFERAGELPAHWQVSDVGQEGEHKVELLLNCRSARGVTHYLVLWRGHASSDDSLAGAVAPRAEAPARVGFGPGGLAVRWRSFVRVAGHE